MFYKQFIRRRPEKKGVLVVSAIVILIQWMIFKYFFPYPNFMPPDSNSYIEAASDNRFIDIWPIGYSKFLRLFSCVTSSDLALVSFQYFLLQGAILYFLVTVDYFMPLNRWIFRIILAINILNPLLIHLSNFISSDAVFISLSLAWITQLIWIIFQPNRGLFLWHAAIVLLCVMVWYNALYYPVISLLVIWFTRLPRNAKTIGMIGIIGPILFFIGKTQYEYKQQTDTVQFSAFGGWQLAANALYGYAHIQSLPPEKIRLRFRKLHRLVNHYLDSLKQITQMPDEIHGINYLSDNKALLKQYMNQHLQKDTMNNIFKQWAKMGLLYSQYGWHLIFSNPRSFVQYYIWPNLVKYYLPPTGVMGWYNRGEKKVDPVVVKWFRWKNINIYNRFGVRKIEIVSYFKYFIAVSNLAFVLCWIAYMSLTGFRISTYKDHGIAWWMALIWFTNMSFSIWASPIELRYQIFPNTIMLIFTGLLLTWIIQWKRSLATANQKQSIMHTESTI
jgi:hypothetical protein